MSKEDDPEFQTKELCNEKHKRVDEKMDCYEQDIKNVKRSITATLIFIIITLITLLIEIAKSHVAV